MIRHTVVALLSGVHTCALPTATARPAMREAITRFASIVSGLPPTFFLATTCSLCAERAEEWDDRLMPFCSRHKAEIRRRVGREARRPTAETQADRKGGGSGKSGSLTCVLGGRSVV